MTVLTRATRATAVLASTSAAVAVFNALFVPGLRRPSRDVTERVAVCIPARNEVDTLPALIGDLTRQRFCTDLQVFDRRNGSRCRHRGERRSAIPRRDLPRVAAARMDG
jgi:hypothetical protein